MSIVKGAVTVTLDLGALGEVEATASYSIWGKHYPATRTDPEEFPETEITSVMASLFGEDRDLLDMLTEAELECIEDQVNSYINESGYDEY